MACLLCLEGDHTSTNHVAAITSTRKQYDSSRDSINANKKGFPFIRGVSAITGEGLGMDYSYGPPKGSQATEALKGPLRGCMKTGWCPIALNSPGPRVPITLLPWFKN